MEIVHQVFGQLTGIIISSHVEHNLISLTDRL